MFVGEIDAIQYKNALRVEPEVPTCVNVRKDTGLEEACYTVGNSAWDPEAPLDDPMDMGWKNGWNAMYWYSKEKCTKGGCPMEGDPNHVGSTETINFTNNGEF